MAAILVTDGEQRAALAIVRSLGRAGHRTFVCSSRRRSLAGASRYARGHKELPDALDAPNDFVCGVRRLVAHWGIDVLLPVTEQSLLAILPERHTFGQVSIPFPSADRFVEISNKARVLEAASALGVAVPDQRTLMMPQERDRLNPAELRFPLVLKPARSVYESSGGRAKVGVTHISDWNALEPTLDRLPPQAYPILLQQRVVGPGVGIFLLVWHDEMIAVFAHRRIREKPPAGGVSVYRESIPADPRLVDLSSQLLERFSWHGVAMIEYKRDTACGITYLMEINGRFWGSLQLAIDSGVDFPLLLVSAALNKRPAKADQYRVGVKSRWWWGEVDHLAARLRLPPEALGLAPGAPTRWRAVADFLTVWHRGARNEVLRLSDPAPFLRESLDWIQGR